MNAKNHKLKYYCNNVTETKARNSMNWKNEKALKFVLLFHEKLESIPI